MMKIVPYLACLLALVCISGVTIAKKNIPKIKIKMQTTRKFAPRMSMWKLFFQSLFDPLLGGALPNTHISLNGTSISNTIATPSMGSSVGPVCGPNGCI